MFCVLHRNSRSALKMPGKRFLLKVASTLWWSLQDKNFEEIVLSLTITKINAFWYIRRKAIWPPKVAGKGFLHNSSVNSEDTMWLTKFIKIAVIHSVSEISTFFVLS